MSIAGSRDSHDSAWSTSQAVVDVPSGACPLQLDFSAFSAHRRVVTDSKTCQSSPTAPRRLAGGAEAVGGAPA